MQTVDILLPTYNGGKYLFEQIASILAQSYPHINLLIRDDGSQDNSIAIIEDFRHSDARIKFYSDIDGNIGLVKNIEYLLTQSDADYIMYCDQDDVWLIDKVQKMINEILFHEKKFGQKMPLLIHSDAYVADENLKPLGKFKGSLPLRYGLNNSLFRYHVQGASCIFNKLLKLEILPFINSIYLHDRYTHLVAEIVGKRFYLNEALMLYRQHSANVLGSKGLIEKIKSNVSRKHSFFLEKDKALIKSLAKSYPENELLKIYLSITDDNHLSRYKKFRLLLKYNISLRPKEWFWFIVSNPYQ